MAVRRGGLPRCATDPRASCRAVLRSGFEIDPGTRGLFADTDLRSQGGKLMAAIGMVVHALDAPESMVEKVTELARRHVDYGVEDRHYATVGAALLWTLQVGLGEAFTPEIREAWASAYHMLSEKMMAAAREAGSGPSNSERARNMLGSLSGTGRLASASRSGCAVSPRRARDRASANARSRP
jgi:hemoglobin-like flavoprotein